ncbi:MAG: hypothetical protein VX755_12365 [Pseudomonadota bacterium]|nr:hypothetical protein [Pseudomonadota bacterium]MED5538678.1 hypothetical protein [Pseudomonadota bacterium]
MSAPKERPILFSGPMVRALLDGRKTQTRRIVKPQPHHGPVGQMVNLGGPDWAIDDGDLSGQWRCPYGVPGDRLWVREAWGLNDYQFERGPIPKARPLQLDDNVLCYAATEDDAEIRNELRWRPSIHMPRWASRLTLEITDVRVQRLQDISDRGQPNDCIAEGVFADDFASSAGDWLERGFSSIEKARFHDLWTSINGAASWAANPWVWAVSFRVLERAQ